MKIDVHCHFYPDRFLKKLARDGLSAGVSVEKDEWGRTILAQHGTRVVTIQPPHNNVQKRIEDMDRAGFDMQILTLTIPSVDIFPIDIGDTRARTVNDEITLIIRAHPDRFMGFVTLPFRDPELTMRELDRCVNELKLKGVCIGSNINGMGLDDERLFPFYNRMNELELPIHIHPRAPADKVTYMDYRLGPMIGFEADLCVAVVRLVMGGVLEKFPNLKFIVSHLGGAIPFLVEKIQNCYEAYPECQVNISRPAKEYLKEFYFDTVSFFEPALMCAYEFFGADHLILGSDYPHVIGDIEEAITSIEELKISSEEKDLIFSGNILKLMGCN